MRRSRIAIMCVALFAAVLTLGSSALAQSKMTGQLQSWTADANGWREIPDTQLPPNVYWPGGKFSVSSSLQAEMDDDDDKATWNFGYAVSGYATFLWKSPFGQQWASPETYIRPVSSGSVYLGMTYIENYYHGVAIVKGNTGPASVGEYEIYFGKSGYKAKTDAGFVANTINLTQRRYCPYIGMGVDGAYSLYVLNKNNNVMQPFPMSSTYGLYDPGEIYVLNIDLDQIVEQIEMRSAAGTVNAMSNALSKKAVPGSADRITEHKKNLAEQRAEALKNAENGKSDESMKKSSSKEEKKIGERKGAKRENRRNANRAANQGKRERKAARK